MFSSNVQSSQYLNQEVSIGKNRVAKYQDFFMRIRPIATTMVSEFNQLKSSLQSAGTAYLNEMENKFFRKGGVKRAQLFVSKINKARDISELTLALEEVIKEGNEDHDSLKTFLYKSLNLNFKLESIYENNPYVALSYTQTLEILVSEIKRLAKTDLLEKISDSSQVNISTRIKLIQK